MATLISVYNSDGCVGRCDEKCHGALQPECHCICGGVNHGVGLAQARKNTQSLSDEQVKTVCETADACLIALGRAAGGPIRIFKEEQQLELFRQGT